MATKKVIAPNVVRGGIAIPLKGKANYYYMSGRKHKEGGIDIGKNPRTGLEVEDGEVMHIADNEIKVFSSVPFLNGKSPAQKVLGGENPTTVFRQQEAFKDRNGINDDGSRKKQRGGRVYPSSTDDYYDNGRNNLGVYTTRTDAIRGPQLIRREDLIGNVAAINKAIQDREQRLYNSSRPRTDLDFRVSGPTGDVVTNDPSNLWWRSKLNFKRNIPLGILYTDEKGNDVPFYTEATVVGRRPKKIHEYSSADVAGGVTGGVFNWTSPSQVFGTVSDIYNKKLNWAEGMILGNSGFVTDRFMEEHPVYGSLANLAGDIAITGPKALSSVPKGATSLARNTKKVVTAGRNIGRRAISKIDDIVEQGNNKIAAAKNRFGDVIDNLSNQLYPSRQAYVQGLDGNYYPVNDAFSDNYMSFSRKKNKGLNRKNSGSSESSGKNGLNNTNTKNNIPAATEELDAIPVATNEVDNISVEDLTANINNTLGITSEISANVPKKKHSFRRHLSNIWKKEKDNIDVDDFDDDIDEVNVKPNDNTPKKKPLFRRLIRNIWEKEKKPFVGMATGAGILGSGVSLYNWMNDDVTPDETTPSNFYIKPNSIDTIPYISPDFNKPIYYNPEDSIPTKRMGGNINRNTEYTRKRKKAKAGTKDRSTTIANYLSFPKIYPRKPKFEDWYKTVPIEINDTSSYNLRRAYELLPFNKLENWRKSNGNTHLRSIVFRNDGNYEFLKSKKHPTYNDEIKWYNSDEGAEFRNHYSLDESTEYPTYRKRKKAGGLYSVTVNGKTSLKRFPSTGDRTKAKFGVDIPLSYNVPNIVSIDENLNPIYNPGDIPIDVINGTYLPPMKGTKPNFNTNLIDKYGKDIWGNLRVKPFVPHKSVRPFKRFINNTTNYLKNDPNAANDLIGLSSNIASGLISHRINRNMLNNLKYVGQPIPKSSVKLKTRININPQLDKMRENLADYERTINNNTTSSNVALARRNQARLANTMQVNELYGNKENTETGLINQDRTNQQAIANDNVTSYNKWLEGLNNFRNSIIDKKSENNISLINNINSGIQDLIGHRERRRSENQTIAAMTLANPDLPVEVLYKQGLISKDVYDAYVKAYRNKNKNNAS